MERVIDYAGFIPSIDETSSVTSAVERVHMEAPSDSLTKLFFKKTGDSIEGVLEVISSNGSFSAQAQGEELMALADSLIQSVRAQLRSWKELRFRDLDFE